MAAEDLRIGEGWRIRSRKVNEGFEHNLLPFDANGWDVNGRDSEDSR